MGGAVLAEGVVLFVKAGKERERERQACQTGVQAGKVSLQRTGRWKKGGARMAGAAFWS